MNSIRKSRIWAYQLRLWLFTLLATLICLILVGGATRLTDSGLSITEWQPVIGIIPPLTLEDWQEAFLKYQQIPEYQLVNAGMSLDEFKTIFWWEWGHRFLGRFTGLIFLIPFLYFIIRQRIDQKLMIQLIGLFFLGGLQGALGWYMVKSGLVDRVDVSQYRLAAHLGLAMIITSYVLWIARGLGRPEIVAEKRTASGIMLAATVVITGLVLLQLLLGAFVAGTKAGFSYNTWPLMDGKWIPSGLLKLEPWYLNYLENPVTLQFDHRLLAYVLLVLAMIHLIWIARRQGEGRLLVFSALLFLSVIIQTTLGIWALLQVVPLELGLLHQAGGIGVLLISVMQLQETIWHLASDQRQNQFA